VSFDSVARSYRVLETIAFGNALQRARTRWIAALPKARRALIGGEGDGRFISELLGAQPDLEIDCVDASAKMLALAEQSLRKTYPAALARVRFIHEDILKWSPNGPYDLLVTHFFLDCFDAPEVKRVVEKLARAAAPRAVWLVADFATPESGLGKLHAQIWLRVMYLFFRMTAGLQTRELVDASANIRAQGFVCREREVSRFGMLKSEMWVRNALL
jgi:ubiquinone/menaquinone biosynthesis C-methylase UbiE